MDWKMNMTRRHTLPLLTLVLALSASAQPDKILQGLGGHESDA